MVQHATITEEALQQIRQRMGVPLRRRQPHIRMATQDTMLQPMQVGDTITAVSALSGLEEKGSAFARRERVSCPASIETWGPF